MKVLIFGGSFSPPTLAHEAIIRQCLALPQFDEVWMMPCGERTDKTMSADDQNRLEMIWLVKRHSFQNDPRLIISDFELKLPRPTSTHTTLQALGAAYPDTEFWWALGTDSFFSMPHTWEHGAELQKRLNLLVFTSEAQTNITAPNVTILRLPAELARTSSTSARQSVAAGVPPKAVSRPVLDYISRHRLYK